MKMKIASLCAVSALVAVSAQAVAGEWSGKASYTPVSTETIKLSDGRTLTRTVVAGYVQGDGAGNPFDSLRQTCSSTTIAAADGKEMESFGHCDALSAKQDLFVLSFHNDDWRAEGGTGQYSAMKGGGTTKLLQTWPDGSYIISWTGNTTP